MSGEDLRRINVVGAVQHVLLRQDGRLIMRETPMRSSRTITGLDMFHPNNRFYQFCRNPHSQTLANSSINQENACEMTCWFQHSCWMIGKRERMIAQLRPGVRRTGLGLTRCS
ncbi:hypothetical protein ACF1BQ_028215 [Bradyrhizobium sp. RDT10]